MYLFGFHLEKNKKQSPNRYTLVEEQTSTNKLNYKIELHNNQLREVFIQSEKPFSRIEANQIISFTVRDVVTFSSKINSNLITYSKADGTTDKLVDYWLKHTYFPILLTFENKYYFLHAGAVEIEDTSVLFVANSFGGKSTLTDFFIKKGHTMISDDKVATFEKDNMIFSVPSYPYHRPYRKMEDLGLFVENFAEESKPINCILNLVKSDPLCEIKVSQTLGIDKFKIIRYSTEIDLPIHKKQRFKALTNIANKVDIYDITIPWDLNRLEEVYQAIVKFIKNKKVI